MGSRPVEWDAAQAAAAEAEADEDWAVYLADLARYRRWRLAERPAEYLARLERLLDSLVEDLREIERLHGSLDPNLQGSGDASAEEGAWLAYVRLFHALVTVLDGTKWAVAREFPGGENPCSFADAFRLLTQAGVLPEGYSADGEALVRLRNRLAHAWEWRPSAAEMRRLLAASLPRLRGFVAHLRARYAGDPEAPGGSE